MISWCNATKQLYGFIQHVGETTPLKQAVQDNDANITTDDADSVEGRKLSSNNLHNSLQIMHASTTMHMQRKHIAWYNSAQLTQ